MEHFLSAVAFDAVLMRAGRCPRGASPNGGHCRDGSACSGAEARRRHPAQRRPIMEQFLSVIFFDARLKDARRPLPGGDGASPSGGHCRGGSACSGAEPSKRAAAARISRTIRRATVRTAGSCRSSWCITSHCSWSSSAIGPRAARAPARRRRQSRAAAPAPPRRARGRARCAGFRRLDADLGRVAGAQPGGAGGQRAQRRDERVRRRGPGVDGEGGGPEPPPGQPGLLRPAVPEPDVGGAAADVEPLLAGQEAQPEVVVRADQRARRSAPGTGWSRCRPRPAPCARRATVAPALDGEHRRLDRLGLASRSRPAAVSM